MAEQLQAYDRSARDFGPPYASPRAALEDEVMIRMRVAEMREELGHAVTAEADDVGRATELAQTGLFDLPSSTSI